MRLYCEHIFSLFPENDVETCCLLERIQKANDYVEIGVDAEEYYIQFV